MQAENGNIPLLEIKNVKKYFPIRKGFSKKEIGMLKAVDGISFSLMEGEVLGLVGESGCGKTTLGRLILRAYEVTDGEILLNIDGSARDITRMDKKELRATRRQMQMIFQDPFGSLDPRKTVLDIVGEPLKVNGLASGEELQEKVRELMEMVGLNADYIRRYPHAFSGGQRQRIGIARALAVNPKLIVCDEAVSALDVSVQAQIINLLQELQQKYGFSYIFISHGLNVVRHISTRVAVMYVGKIVEMAPTDILYGVPKHPYTEAILSAAPSASLDLKRKRIILEGEVANPAAIPSGCPFHPRCPYAQERCGIDIPTYREVEPGHFCACHFATELNLAGVDS